MSASVTRSADGAVDGLPPLRLSASSSNDTPAPRPGTAPSFTGMTTDAQPPPLFDTDEPWMSPRLRLRIMTAAPLEAPRPGPRGERASE